MDDGASPGGCDVWVCQDEVAAIASGSDLFEPCSIWQWNCTAVLLMFKFAEDPGPRPEILSIEGFFTFGDLDRAPGNDKPIPLEAYVHVVLLDAWEVKDGGYS